MAASTPYSNAPESKSPTQSRMRDHRVTRKSPETKRDFWIARRRSDALANDRAAQLDLDARSSADTVAAPSAAEGRVTEHQEPLRTRGAP